MILSPFLCQPTFLLNSKHPLLLHNVKHLRLHPTCSLDPIEHKQKNNENLEDIGKDVLIVLYLMFNEEFLIVLQHLSNVPLNIASKEYEEVAGYPYSNQNSNKITIDLILAFENASNYLHKTEEED